MAYPAYLRTRARELRTIRQLTLTEICERLALPKTTVYYWIRDLPLERPRHASAGRRKGDRNMRAKYKRLRDEAYARGWEEYDELVKLPTFRDFVVLYIAEGYKCDRNCVAICNSDPLVMELATAWMPRLAERDLTYAVHHHADQDLDELRAFWGELLGIAGAQIRVHHRSNSGQLAGRRWRCVHGVLTVNAHETLLRARLQAWIDRVRGEWG